MALLDRLTLLIDANGQPAIGELDRVGRKARETLTIGERFSRDFLQGLGIGAGASAGLVAAESIQRLARFLVEAGQAASEDARAQVVLSTTLRNTTSATDEQVDSTEAWIANLSRAKGIADDELRPALATLVRSTEDVASAQRLLQLALDVSAGTGKDVTTVSTALAKAYEGQTTALTRLVPETVGLVREGGSLADVLEDLDRSFGGVSDAASEADPFSRLTVEANELKETIGTGVLPAFEATNAALGDIAGNAERATNALAGIADFAKSAKQSLGGLIPGSLLSDGNKLERQLGQLAAARESFRNLAPDLDRLAASGGFAGNLLAKLIDNAAPGLREIGDSGRSSADGLDTMTRSVQDLDDAVTSLFDGIFGLSSAQDRFNDALDDGADSSGRSSRSTRDAIAADFDRERSTRNVLAAQEELAEAERNLEEVRKGASEREKNRARLDVTTAQNRIAQAQQRIAEATNALNRATGRRGNAQDAAKARQDLADAILEEERAHEDLADTQERANETMQRGTEGSKDLADATKRVEDAQWSLREAIEAQRQQGLQDQSDGGPVGRTASQQRDKFREAAKAAGEIITELINAGAPQDVLNGKIQEMVTRLQDAGTAAGATKDEIQKTADLLVALGAINQAETERQLASSYGFGYTTLREGLDSLKKRGFYVPDIAYTLAGGRAAGGSANAGATYRVGERGPEYLTMGNSPGWVTPMSEGGATFVFNGPVVADRANLERLVWEAWQSAQRRGWN